MQSPQRLSNLPDSRLGPAITTASLSLFRFASIPARFWVLGQMALARLSFTRMPEALFWKLCGSGTGEGFTPKPNTQVWAILATWPDPGTARRCITTAPVFQRWRTHASESWTILLEPTSSRGKWSGQNPFTPTTTPDGPPDKTIVALTRATMRAKTFLRFWRRVPDISTVIGQDPNVIFKIGIGEVPFLHQITFSIWPDAAAMAHFARGDGPHGRAIQAVRAEDWFAEELYARFRIVEDWGTWGGKSPLRQT